MFQFLATAAVMLTGSPTEATAATPAPVEQTAPAQPGPTKPVQPSPQPYTAPPRNLATGPAYGFSNFHRPEQRRKVKTGGKKRRWIIL